MKAKEEKAALIKRLSWPAIRLACVSIKAKSVFLSFVEEKVTPSHVINHAEFLGTLMTKVFDLLGDENSVSKLTDLY